MLRDVIRKDQKIGDRDLVLLISCLSTFLSRVDQEEEDSFSCEEELTYLLDKLIDEMAKLNDDHIREVLERLSTSINKKSRVYKITDKTRDFLTKLLNDHAFLKDFEERERFVDLLVLVKKFEINAPVLRNFIGAHNPNFSSKRSAYLVLSYVTKSPLTEKSV